jgi:hypothetical protein
MVWNYSKKKLQFTGSFKVFNCKKELAFDVSAAKSFLFYSKVLVGTTSFDVNVIVFVNGCPPLEVSYLTQ